MSSALSFSSPNLSCALSFSSLNLSVSALAYHTITQESPRGLLFISLRSRSSFSFASFSLAVYALEHRTTTQESPRGLPFVSLSSRSSLSLSAVKTRTSSWSPLSSTAARIFSSTDGVGCFTKPSCTFVAVRGGEGAQDLDWKRLDKTQC